MVHDGNENGGSQDHDEVHNSDENEGSRDCDKVPDGNENEGSRDRGKMHDDNENGAPLSSCQENPDTPTHQDSNMVDNRTVSCDDVQMFDDDRMPEPQQQPILQKGCGSPPLEGKIVGERAGEGIEARPWAGLPRHDTPRLTTLRVQVELRVLGGRHDLLARGWPLSRHYGAFPGAHDGHYLFPCYDPTSGERPRRPNLGYNECHGHDQQ
ncbi:hypothetical protein ACE6H2_015748 [Prunus campanulata]